VFTPTFGFAYTPIGAPIQIFGANKVFVSPIVGTVCTNNIDPACAQEETDA
jgi:hypothetical protein